MVLRAGVLYYGSGLPRFGATASLSPVGVLAAVNGWAWTGSVASLGALGWFFFKAGLLTFGSGLAMVPFLQHGWSRSTAG